MVQASSTSRCFLILLLLVAATVLKSHTRDLILLFTSAREIKTEVEDTDGGQRISSGAAGEVKNKEAGNKEKQDHHHAHPSSSAMIKNHHHLDPSLFVFFFPEDLYTGKTMRLYFPKRNPSTSPKLLSRQEADSIPFSSKQIPRLLELFSFSQSSPQAKAIEYTLEQCESKPIKGEIKFCATSLESLLDSTRSILGRWDDDDAKSLRVLTTKHLIRSNTTFQNYTIADVPQKVEAPKMVACHTMPYPYAVYYCHSHKHDNRVFEVSLAGANGDLIRALAVCHMDTSHWDPDHVSFRVLGVEPGTTPVCHFFPADHLMWVSD